MLELHNVSIDIVGVPVLRDVHLVVPPGGGRGVIGGKAPPAAPPHHRARLGIGYAPEERRLFGSFSVRENMLLPAEVLRLAPAEVARRLDAVFTLLPELKDLAPRRAAGLSGGQGKMVALGRALMVGTRAVLLDEPFQGLAPALAQRYAEALRRLHLALPDVAILITESNPELLRPLVESTFVIERGEIAAA